MSRRHHTYNQPRADWWEQAPQWARYLIQQQEKTMDEIRDLKLAVAQALQDISDETQALGDAVARVLAEVASPKPDLHEVRDAADALNASHAGMQDAVAKAKAALAPKVEPLPEPVPVPEPVPEPATPPEPTPPSEPVKPLTEVTVTPEGLVEKPKA